MLSESSVLNATIAGNEWLNDLEETRTDQLRQVVTCQELHV